MWEWPRVVLEQLLASAILSSASRQHVTVFVDALDEAGAESAQQLAAYFHQLINRAEKSNVAIQICISSRHYPIMEITQAIEIYVEDHNHEDIATYTKDMLAGTEFSDNRSEETKKALVEQLIQQANGVFQWAHLIMPRIRQKIYEGKSFDDIRCWLREVPAGLEHVYIYILNNVIEARNREQSFLFFQWVCLAERALNVTEVRYALVAKNTQITPFPTTWEKIGGFIESNKRMKRRIKALSGGLVEVVSSGDGKETVQVVHQSVNDFLRVKGLGLLFHHTGASTSSMESEKIIFLCQAALYRSCLVYLTTIHIPGLCDYSRKRMCLFQNHPLLAYATLNLFIHGEKAAGSRADVLQNEQVILQQVIGRWVQFYMTLDPCGKECPPEGTRLLHMAAAANLVDLIKPVVSNGEDIGKRNGDGNTAFHLAARRGHVTAGKILREMGADLEAKSKYGTTALVEAASCGHVRFVEWLLDEGVKLGTARVGSGSALQAASLRGHQSVVGILLAAGADVDVQGGRYGNALHAAACEGHIEIVRMLLDAHADVNAQGGNFGNALQAASYNGHLEIVRILLDAHADVNAKGGKFGNALQAAIYHQRIGIMRMLLDAHADVNTKTGEFGNLLQAAAYGGHTEIVRMLLDAYADVNAQGGEYGNALQAAAAAAAAYGGNIELVRMVLGAHADVNAQGCYFSNALQAATHEGYTEIVRMLLDAHANATATT
jgi:ankyrin repeat protein